MSEQVHLVSPAVGSSGKPAGRLPFAFGRRFFLLLLIGLVWLGPAWEDHRYIYAMMLWNVAVLVVWGWDLFRLPSPAQLEVQRSWNTSLQLSVEAIVTLELRNSGGVQTNAELLDDVPSSLRAELPKVEITAPRQTGATGTYLLRPRERGDARLGNIFVRYQTAWHLAERWASMELAQTVRVYPNLQESKRDTLYLIRSRQIALEKRLKHQAGQGREFESLREYREGDEWRDVCWSATARRNKLISKTYQIERSQTVWLVLDTGRLLRTRVLGLSKLDYAINAALSLAQVALYSGDRVAMMAYGRRAQQRMPPGRGPSHLRLMLEGLAQAHGEEFEADHMRAAETLLVFQKRRSLVVWLTDLAETPTTPDVIEAASQLARRHLLLFTVIGQPELAELLAQRPENERQMYHYAAAQEIVQRRDVLLGTLRQQGALTVEVDPTRLSTALVNQYLSVKERSLI